MHLTIKEAVPPRSHVEDLYNSVGWSAYTRDMSNLMTGLANSSFCAAAYTHPAGAEFPTLMGLVRVLSDDATVCFIQDVLVRPVAQRTGVGHHLVSRVLKRYAHVRQIELITDDDPAQHAFYASLGFTLSTQHPGGRLNAYVIIRNPDGHGAQPG